MSKSFDPFEVFEVSLLSPIKTMTGSVPAGQKAYAAYAPNGRIYLSESGEVGTTKLGPVGMVGAELGVHFDADPSVAQRLWTQPRFENKAGLWTKRPGA